MNSRSTHHQSSTSSKNNPTADTFPVAHPNVLACKCQGSTYGVSFIPWDERIRFQAPLPSMNLLPHIIGAISLSDCIVPVFDLRPESIRTREGSESTAYLLTVSMLSKAMGPMAVGLLVEATSGRINILPNAILNLAISN